MSVPDEMASRVLVQCGRHCCICRRYRPTQLQVHHIIEKSQGGSDEEDNLIALCITCHSDVHTKRPFTRRFTHEEQKQHRDNVYRLVAEGRLVPENESFSLDFIQSYGNEKGLVSTEAYSDMLHEAVEVLLACSESKNGYVVFRKSFSGCNIFSGDLNKQLTSDRDRALYEAALEQLTDLGLLEQRGWDNGGIWNMTHKGYLLADEVGATIAN